VLPDEGLAIAQPVGEDDRLAVLAQDIRVGTQRRVNGLDEESELQLIRHVVSLLEGIAGPGPKTKTPASAADRGLGLELFQALAGAGLPDHDDYYDAWALNRLAFHAAYLITRDSSGHCDQDSARSNESLGIRYFLGSELDATNPPCG